MFTGAIIIIVLFAETIIIILMFTRAIIIIVMYRRNNYHYSYVDRSKAGKRKTKVKKHTLNPVFEEILRVYMGIFILKNIFESLVCDRMRNTFSTIYF